MSGSLLKSSGVVGLMTLLSRILGFVRDTMLFHVFGAGGGMDAFLVAQAIPNFGRRLFAEGAFQQAFVPVFVETKTQQSHEDVRDLVAVTMGTLGSALALITLLGCLFPAALIFLFASGFAQTPEKAALASSLLAWTFPYLMFISLTSLCGSALNAYHRFAIPAVTPVILNLCLIGSMFIDDSSVKVLAYALFAAGVLQFLFQLPSMLALRILPWPRWGWSDGRVRRILKLMGPVVIGSGVAQISLLINSNLATQLGDGPYSWLYGADRLMEFPLGVFSIAVGTVILPTLSAHHAKQSTQEFSATLDWGLRMILVIGLPAALGLALLAGPLVATIFGHGEFTPVDVRMTTFALWAYSLGFMGFSMVKVLVPGFYARQETRLPAQIGILALCAGMAVSLGLFATAKAMKFDAAHVGLAFATSFTACLNAAMLLSRLRRDGIYAPSGGWAKFLVQVLTACAFMTLIIVLASGSLSDWLAEGHLHRALRLAGIIAAAMTAYFTTLFLCGLRPGDFRRH